MPPLPPDLRECLQWVADGVALIGPPPGWRGAASMLVEDGDVLLVDAGLPPEMRRRLAPYVDVCILTHVHAAHVSGAADFREVWAPREEARAMRGEGDFCDVVGVARRDRDAVLEWLPETGYAPADVAKAYRPGGILKLDTYEWHLLAAPGHSPGLTLLHEPKRHILFAADLDGSEHAAWYGWPSCDADELEQTAQALAKVDVAILLGSHAPPRKRGIRQMFRGIAETIHERDRRVLALLEEPHTLDELVSHAPVGGRVPGSPIGRYFERVMAEKHVLRLLAKDYVAARQDGRYERVD